MPESCVVLVTVQPGARRDAVVGRHGDGIKVSVRAAPEAGRATAAVLALVADLAGVPRAQVRLVSGATHRVKRIAIDGRSLAEVIGRAEAAAG